MATGPSTYCFQKQVNSLLITQTCLQALLGSRSAAEAPRGHIQPAAGGEAPPISWTVGFCVWKDSGSAIRRHHGDPQMQDITWNQPLSCSGSSGGMCELVLSFQSCSPLPTAAGCSLHSWRGTGWAMQLSPDVEPSLLGRGLTSGWSYRQMGQEIR